MDILLTMDAGARQGCAYDGTGCRLIPLSQELPQLLCRILHWRSWPLLTFVLWCVLLVLCWPVALAALLLYPIIWLLLLPFRIVGIAVDGVLKLIWTIVTLPARLLSSPGRV